MKVIRTIAEMRAWQHSAPATAACVPTMGALHEGHLRLVTEAQKKADAVVVTIFVNPTQFGPNEDFAKYPRDEAGDLAKCEAAGVAAIFMPDPSEMYAPDASVFVDETRLSERLCGARRPGHFRGVCTVVLKLMHIVGARFWFFGEKDFQQLAVVRRMVRDLDVGVEVFGVPIVREADGLAMSSRNRYLSQAERAQALGLNRALKIATELATAGERDAKKIIEEMRREIEAAGLRVDYVEITDATTLEPVGKITQNCRALVAAHCGVTRLIDNCGIGNE